jgi:lipoprotein-releasing system ATP-binding protein
MLEPVLELQNINKTYTQGAMNIEVLRDVSLSINRGQLVGLLGPSGCGKSSLLHIAGLLDQATSGKVLIMGNDYAKSSDQIITKARATNLGFIYQFHHLLSDFTALENVMMPQLILGVSKKIAKQKAIELLEQVALADRLHHLPGELSGGQQQRVAIVRALANNPKVLLADEATGNLDYKSAGLVFDMILEQTKKHNIACLFVTHNVGLVEKMDTCYGIEAGVIKKI